MDPISALSCCIVTCLGVIYWYHYCLRIYNRFQYSSSGESQYEAKDDREKLMESIEDSSFSNGNTNNNDETSNVNGNTNDNDKK